MKIDVIKNDVIKIDGLLVGPDLLNAWVVCTWLTFVPNMGVEFFV